MNKPIIILLFSLFSFNAFSQKFELDIHKNKLSGFIKIEEGLKSERFENKTEYISGKGVAQPVIFRRKEKNLPDLLCNYFYFKKDSTIDYILYEWDDNNFKEHKDNNKKSPKEIEAFIDKYKEINVYISKIYGVGVRDGNIDDLSKIETGDFNLEDDWNPNDSTKILLEMTLSNEYKKEGPMSVTPTYRIRLYLNNVKVKSNDADTGIPDPKKINKLDTVLRKFWVELKNDSLEKAKSFFSEALIKVVTNEQLKTLKQNLAFNEELEIYMSGLQMGLDGSILTMLQYKYKTDTNNPPLRLVKVIFDENNKMLGIQPVKMQ